MQDVWVLQLQELSQTLLDDDEHDNVCVPSARERARALRDRQTDRQTDRQKDKTTDRPCERDLAG